MYAVSVHFCSGQDPIRVCVFVECVYSNGIAGLVWSSVVVEIICLNDWRLELCCHNIHSYFK